MPHILIIDDESAIRSLLSRILESNGYTVSEASDGQKGVYLLETQPVDLIITDILMPAKDGLETIREIRRDHPDIKIIAISGGSPRWDYMEFLPIAKKFGAHAILPKPFHQQDLLTVVRDVLGQSAAITAR
jgi:CheY-like chemotaxis protein